MNKIADNTTITPDTDADDTFKGKFRIRIIQAGLSRNGNYYADQTLQDAASLFDGVRVFVKSDAEHIAGRGKDIRNLIGRITGVAFTAGTQKDSGELQGTLELLEPESPIATKIKDAWDKGMVNLFGFSIDAKSKSQRGRIGGKAARIATKFIAVNSVDLIVDPGAGGEVINLIESKGTQTMKEENILSTDDVRRFVEATNLPGAAKHKLIAENTPPSRVTETDLREAISKEADYLANFTESGKVTGLGGEENTICITEGRDQKVSKMLDAFFDPQDRSVVSIRECYRQITGDSNFTGLVRNCDESLLRESLGSASFPDVLGDSINRRLVAEYRTDTIYDVWRNLATIVPVNDFRTQERARFGGYGDLPMVGEGSEYAALTSPTDEKATYAVAKRGGTEDLTLEMIINDDVSAVSRIPQKLVRSAKRTLSRFVLDFLKDNPTIYDGVNLFHANHGNLGNDPLDITSLAAGRLAMKRQTGRDSEEKIGLGPRFLWVPDELEKTAVDLFRRNTEQDKTFIQSLSLDVVPVWYWEDINDWCLTTDPVDVPIVEIGFLGGNEEPELFVQDSPTVGSMFTHDKTTYKIRHIYGGAVTDYRGAYKSVVA